MVMQRYLLAVKMDQYREHRGVVMSLFHLDWLPEEVYAAMIPNPLLRKDPDARLAVNTSFSVDETETLREWFAACPGVTFLPEVDAGPVGENETGIRCWGGTSGLLEFFKHEAWPLPCRVAGWYELQSADDGPYVENPNLAQTRIWLGPDGQCVLKQPPF